MALGTKLGIISLSGAGSSFSNIYSTEYDGSDDYVTIGTPTNLKITGNVSISVWFKFLSSDSQVLFDGFDKWGLYTFTGKLRFKFRNASDAFKYVESSGTVTDGNWHHVLAVNDQTNLKIYIDGVLSNSNADGSVGIVGVTDVRIGARWNNSLYTNGNIDEVAIWNNDQSSNISTIYNGGTPNDLSSLSPLTWWRFEEGSGTTAIDSGTGGNNGTLTNGVTYSTDVP